MAKKHKKQSPEDLIKLIHPDIGFDEPEDVEQSGQQKQSGPDYEALLTAMQQQVAQMQSQMETLHRTNMALMAQPVSAAPAPKVTEFSMENLPDPALQPTEYAREVNRRVQDSIRSQQEYARFQQQQAQSSQGVEEQLWERFQQTYSAYAGDPKKVRYVAEQVIADAQKRGLDVNKYIMGAQDVFMADVAREYDALFGKPRDPDEEDNDEDESNEEDDTRTGGMFGGATTGGRPTAGAEADSDMFTALRQRKIKEGWY